MFTSDHGDLLGDHNLFRKALPYEGSTRVPFIAWTPPRCDLGLRRGSVVERPVELRDVMPTLFDAAGLESRGLDGKSLLPLASGKPARWRRYIHGEYTWMSESVQFVTDGREKYVWFSGSGREQFFDLESDPEELRDLAADKSATARIARWRAVLVKELEPREEGMSDGKRLITGRPVRPCLKNVFGDV